MNNKRGVILCIAQNTSQFNNDLEKNTAINQNSIFVIIACKFRNRWQPAHTVIPNSIMKIQNSANKLKVKFKDKTCTY